MVLAAVAVGQVVASPTHAHLHRHRDVHAKKDVENWAALDWDNMGINWSSAYEAGQAAKTSTAASATETPAVSPIIALEAKVTPSSSAAVKPAATSAAASSSSSSDDVSDSVASLFKGLVGLSNELTAFGEAAFGTGELVDAVGNIGSPQGSNIIKVDSTSGYDFTNTFINTSKKSMTVVIWNKAYSEAEGGNVEEAKPNLGSCLAPKTPALSFALAPNDQQIVAIMNGTLLGWAEAVDNTIFSGAFATSWGEGKFTDRGSGYDLSAIVNPSGNNYNMAISSKEVECISDPTQNYWIAKDGDSNNPVPVGGSDGSCYVPGTTAHLTTKMGGTM